MQGNTGDQTGCVHGDECKLFDDKIRVARDKKLHVHVGCDVIYHV